MQLINSMSLFTVGACPVDYGAQQDFDAGGALPHPPDRDSGNQYGRACGRIGFLQDSETFSRVGFRRSFNATSGALLEAQTVVSGLNGTTVPCRTTIREQKTYPDPWEPTPEMCL